MENEAFFEFADSQFDSPEARFAQLAADPEIVEIIERIPMDPGEIYYGDFIALEKIANERYGLHGAKGLQLVIDYWEGKQLAERSGNG